MATVTLAKVFVNLLETGEYITAFSTGRSRAYGIPGEVRSYAGGRQRAVTRAGTSTTFAVTLRDLTLAQVTTLEEWAGHAVLVRDHRGQSFTGVYFGVAVDEDYGPVLYDASIEVRSLTVEAGV
jgi:hypothetical protein